MERPTGVLLDVDGTLVDSNDAHAHAWVKALVEAGVRAEFAAVRRLIGKGGDKLDAAVLRESVPGRGRQRRHLPSTLRRSRSTPQRARSCCSTIRAHCPSSLQRSREWQ